MKTMTGKSDAQIQADVLSELRADTRVGGTDVGVGVDAGVVTLTGILDSWSRRFAAQQAAHRVAGVRDVANDITVHSPAAPGRTDAEVAKAVRLALEWDVRVPHEQIQTTVSGGEVTLMGEVEYWSQREDAGEAVRDLAGVTGVSNQIIVRPHAVPPAHVRLAIAEALRRHATREAQHIEMSVVDGEVTLSGIVSSWSERRAAIGAAGAVQGVRSVVDRLTVEPPCR